MVVFIIAKVKKYQKGTGKDGKKEMKGISLWRKWGEKRDPVREPCFF